MVATTFKITVNRIELIGAIRFSSDVIPAKTTKEVLYGLCFDFAPGQLRISASDCMKFASCDLDQIEIEGEGRIIIPADKLQRIVESSPGETVTIEAGENGTVTLSDGDAEFQLSLYPSEDWIPEVNYEPDQHVVLDAADFSRLVRQTVYATSPKAAQWALGSIWIDADGNEVSSVGIHANCAARSVAPTESGEVSELGIPADVAKLVAGHASGSVMISSGSGKVRLDTDGKSIVTVALEGGVPPYKSAFANMQSQKRNKVEFDRKQLIRDLGRAAIMSSMERPGIELTLDESVAHLRAEGFGRGKSSLKLPFNGTGNGEKVKFASKYMELSLAATDDATVGLEVGLETHPVIVSAENFISIVMPISN